MHEGRDIASVSAFVDAAQGRAKTLTLVETENGGSICGGYLDVPWAPVGHYAIDKGKRSFIFTLKNHLGLAPTKFAQRRGTNSEYATCLDGSGGFFFGSPGEGVWVGAGDHYLSSGPTYEAPDGGVALFQGDDGGVFRAARWELWEIE
jgi:hypothetical protein